VSAVGAGESEGLRKGEEERSDSPAFVDEDGKAFEAVEEVPKSPEVPRDRDTDDIYGKVGLIESRTEERTGKSTNSHDIWEEARSAHRRKREKG
jgi:hypothetical protein